MTFQNLKSRIPGLSVVGFMWRHSTPFLKGEVFGLRIYMILAGIPRLDPLKTKPVLYVQGFRAEYWQRLLKALTDPPVIPK